MGDLDLAWALSEYKSSAYRDRLALYLRYYEGDHRFAYATEKFRNTFGTIFKEFADNLCPAVVDSLSERLKIEGWKSSARQVDVEDVSGTEQPGIPPRKRVVVNDPYADQAEELWDDNDLVARADEVHTEALKTGNSYLLVWPGKTMEAEFWPQTAAEMCVEYDANQIGVLARACKVWYVKALKKWRLNIYMPDKVEKYITMNENPNGMPPEVTGWVPFRDPLTGPVLPNPYEIVPVFHFANRRMYKSGISELKDVIPIQDGLNKSIIDMMIAMEFASYKQRYIIGLEPEVDENTGEPVDKNAKEYGVDRMMAIPGDKNEISVGQFDATDLGQFIQVSEKFRQQVARVSGTPLHYFFMTSGDFPSGEAIKSAEARFVRRIESRQEAWGPVWAKALRFGLSIENALPEELSLEPLWKDASPRSDSELADTAVKKRAIGVSRSQLLKEQGYDDDEIDRMLEETDAYDATKASLAATSRGPDALGTDTGNTNGSGGGTPAATAGARQAASEGRVPGVRS